MIRECNKIYYFDNNATTFVYNKEIIDTVNKLMICANPSNTINFLGFKAFTLINNCRKHIARLLKLKQENIIFTSGATEGNNIVIQGIVHNYVNKHNKKATIITSTFEHSSVLDVFKQIENEYHDKIIVKYIDPYTKDKTHPEYGCIRSVDVEELLKNSINPLLVSIMNANNETGAVQDIKTIGRIVQKYGAFFHTDATQTIGRLSKLEFEYCDVITMSAHKFHGMKGSGCIYISDKVKNNIDPLFYGGKQEFGIRPGTENVSGIVAMTMAMAISRRNRVSKNKSQLEKKEWILQQLQKCDIEVIGARKENTLPNTLFISIKDICNINLCRQLSEKCVIVGIGAACHNAKPSHVLKSMNIDKSKYSQVLRISLCDYTTWSDCKHLVENLLSMIKHDK